MTLERHRDRFLTGLAARPLVMGILNITPDSFSDGGDHVAAEVAVARARQMAEEGADVIDIGGESTRPGADVVAEAEELARVLPVIRAVSAEIDLPISVDTYKAAVAEAAIEAGAAIINDVWGLQRDARMAEVAARTSAAVIVMHNRVSEDTALDILADIRAFLDRSKTLAAAAGVAPERILIDPGIGFGKTYDQNLKIMNALDRLHPDGNPVLLGLSRKRMIGTITGRAPKDRMAGTLAANLHGIAKGVRVIRVHDVAPHVDALKTLQALGSIQ